MESVINVTVRLLEKGSGMPLNSEYEVQLYDCDPIIDDYLATGVPDEGGRVKFKFHTGQLASFDSIGELAPDLFFRVFHYRVQIFTSEVEHDLDIRKEGSFDSKEGIKFDLGTYVIDTSSRKSN